MRFGSKYHAKKVEIDGMKFDSKGEYNYWLELQEKEKSGEIVNLRRQVSFEVLPRQNDKNGKCLFRPLKYVADYVFEDKDGVTHVCDYKGFKTQEYIQKRKMLYFTKGILIEEITR